MTRANLAFGAVMDLALSLGGTITGEHGVGRLKKAWLPAYLGDDVMALTHRSRTHSTRRTSSTPGRSSTCRPVTPGARG